MNASSRFSTAQREPGTGTRRGGWRDPVVLSWLMVALAVGFFVVFLIQAGTFHSLTAAPPAPAKVDVTQEKVVVGISSISGFDRENQPYTVNAQTAVQDPDKPNIIHLETVSGELRKSTGRRFTVDARKGVYNSDSKALDLVGDVNIISVGRFVATMPNARVLLSDKELSSHERVEVKFDSGDIVAHGVRITDQGKNIQFLSRVKTRLRAAAKKENKDGND